MEAIKPQAVLQQPLLTSSISSLQSNRESVLQSRASAPARKFTDLPLDILLEVRVQPLVLCRGAGAVGAHL